MCPGYPTLPHPVETQKRHEHLARLHLHRRPAHPVVEGQGPCPDVQEVATRPRNRADQAQPDHARVGQLLPACRLQTHAGQPVPLCVVAGDAVAAQAAPLDVDRRLSPIHHSHWTVKAHRDGRDRTVQPGRGAGHPLPLPRQHDPHPLDPAQPRADGRNRGEPGAVKVARRVRRAALGKRARSNPGTAPQADSTGECDRAQHR